MARSTLEQWRMFKAVAEHGGFHQAAEVVYKSQSTVHHAVHKLEQNRLCKRCPGAQECASGVSAGYICRRALTSPNCCDRSPST